MLLLLACLTGCDAQGPAPQPAGDVLRVCLVDGRLDPAIPEQFQRVTGIEVMVLSSGKNQAAPCDVALVPGDLVPALVAAEAIQPIDRSQVPHAADIAARFTTPPNGSGELYSLPYQWGTVGLLYRKDILEGFEPTWARVFDPGRQPVEGFVLLADPRVMTGLALSYLGHPVNSTDAGELEAAEALLDAVRRSPRRVPSQEADAAALAVVGSAAGLRAVEGDPRLHFAVPRGGGLLRVRAMVIPQDAPHPERGLRFMDYLLDPQISAQVSSYNRAGTPNEAAMPYVSPEDRANAGLYPPPEVMEKLEIVKPAPAKPRDPAE